MKIIGAVIDPIIDHINKGEIAEAVGRILGEIVTSVVNAGAKAVAFLGHILGEGSAIFHSIIAIVVKGQLDQLDNNFDKTFFITESKLADLKEKASNGEIGTMTEVKVISEYLKSGKTVKYEPLGDAGPDLLVDGTYIEIKSTRDALIKTSSNHITPIENNIDKANVQLGRVPDRCQKKLIISINGGLDSSLTKDDVKTHITNYLGKKIFPKGHNIQNIEIIWSDGTRSTGKLINDVMEWNS